MLDFDPVSETNTEEFVTTPLYWVKIAKMAIQSNLRIFKNQSDV